MSRPTLKGLLILAVIALAGYFLFPSIVWYRLPAAERDKLEQRRDRLVGRVLKLGLDLRGGTHLLLELDDTQLDPKLDVKEAIDRAIEIIRNRIDQFGVTEPLIARQGERWIVVQLPGVKDPELAKQLIGKTALLEFRMADSTGVLEKLQEKARQAGLTPSEYIDSQGKVHPLLAQEIPPGRELLPGKESQYVVVHSSAELTGASLVNAKVQLGDQFGFPVVALEFNPEGARTFARVTELNVGKNLAIVLDRIVQSAPVIRTRIPDGRAVIEGNFSADDAKLLATVLRAGALPAPVRIIEERTVGPTLGEDSIRSGVRACVVGLALVLGFMALYYKWSGMVANLALFVNLFLLLGAMAYFHATLTLPGIAGVILSLAMAVDANVLILERVREELRTGKTVGSAIDLGYERAFSAILDGNLTTLIAAAFLFQFGSGPVKGFAVTLTLGLTISMFTAITGTKTVYDLWLPGRKITRLSI